jgi:hypothetical protein
MKKQVKRGQVDWVYIAAKFELVKVRRAVASGIDRYVGTCNASASFNA